MFNSISWQGYWTILALITTGYYLAVYLLYFRKAFTFSFPGRRGGKNPEQLSTRDSPRPTSLFDNEKAEFALPPTGSEEHQVYALMDELSAYFAEAKKSKVIKEEALFALQRMVSKYPSLRTSTYKESLTNVMVSEAALHCSLHLSADDISKVWLG